MRPKITRQHFLIMVFLLAGLALAACSTSTEDGGLTAADFGLPTGEDDHNDDHEHDEGTEEATFDPSLTETDEEGIFIDHHGNRVVDELYQQFEQDGVKIEFTVENFLGVGGRGGEVSSDIRAGERALIKFNMSDATTEEPLAGRRPLAWLELQEGGHFEGDLEEQQALCKEKVEGYLSGLLTARPTVDLNSFFILALNDDASISVIDPTVDVAGMTQLFALIQLTGPGQDWALGPDQGRLFVTVPGTNQVAVAEMDGFDVAQHLDGGVNPQRIAFQPDGGYVWVGNDADRKADSGVTVIDPQTLAIEAFIDTGQGHHELAFSADSRFAFVTNGDEGSLSVIDIEKMAEIEEIDAGRGPLAVAVSEANGAVYVADAATGTLTVVDGEGFDKVAEIETDPGLAALAFAPGGRWALATNPGAGKIYVIDAGSNSVTHVAQVGGGPDQVSFSDGAAYIRARDAALVNVIQLADLEPNSELELASVPVGTLPPGQFPSLPLANTVGAAAKQGAMVIANPLDDQVYFLPEGATAPSGSYQGHSLRPRAVQVVDRSLSEDAPGVYSGRIRVPASGAYLVAIMLGDPLLVHCFEFEAKPNEALDASVAAPPELALLTDPRGFAAGEPTSLQFTLSDPESGEGIDDLEDVLVLATQVAGNWNARQAAVSKGDGVYEVSLTLPKAGLYTLFFAVPSQGLNFDQLPTFNLQATEG